jgi:WXG100 family type VII secretion target
MANLSVSYDEMRQQAHSLRTGQQEITDKLNMLRSQINNLVSSGFVTDQASGAFNSSYEQFNHGATQTVSALDQLAGNLENMANTLQETDAQLAQQMGS